MMCRIRRATLVALELLCQAPILLPPVPLFLIGSPGAFGAWLLLVFSFCFLDLTADGMTQEWVPGFDQGLVLSLPFCFTFSILPSLEEPPSGAYTSERGMLHSHIALLTDGSRGGGHWELLREEVSHA
ncbi:hypothetical protein LX36DRAFT_20700 [Colletotrichum falcatum]|nr:hypothetical protein LX36DRAFT_20700 [Colletotrichum falcatum]